MLLHLISLPKQPDCHGQQQIQRQVSKKYKLIYDKWNNYVCTMSINACTYVPVLVYKILCWALVDSENSAGCCISRQFAEKIGLTPNDISSMCVEIGTSKPKSSPLCLECTKKPQAILFAVGKLWFRFQPGIIKDFCSHINMELKFLCNYGIDQIHSHNC